jgi:hypothetical protein
MPKLQTVMNYINEFDKAAQNYAVVGSYHPDDRETVTDNYKARKAKLQNAVKSLYEDSI